MMGRGRKQEAKRRVGQHKGKGVSRVGERDKYITWDKKGQNGRGEEEVRAFRGLIATTFLNLFYALH
jgi:hypothetical protein